MVRLSKSRQNEEVDETLSTLQRSMRKRDLIIEFLQLIAGFAKKAAPRFELGIKDLQSSALPLGHAALGNSLTYTTHTISLRTSKLLVLSNGHGEDLIALRIIESLHNICPDLEIDVFPLVGEGKCFLDSSSASWLNLVGPRLTLPSGGFSNQSLKGLFSDLKAGLFTLVFQQWKYLRKLRSQNTLILAVGDLLPLFFAWASGAQYIFIGTPKSDYSWKSGPGRSVSDFYHSLKGSEWDPWEVLLMQSQRCGFVAVRDHLTARGLKKKKVLAIAPGNPMMDDFESFSIPLSLLQKRRLLLLCGSRMPEAKRNFIRLLSSICLCTSQKPFSILVPLGAEPLFIDLQEALLENRFKKISFHDELIGADEIWSRGDNFVFLGRGRFTRWARWAEVGIANAGTATEQLVGLGVPVLSLPGKGPQFKSSFAIRQSRLLGGSVVPCKTSESLAERLNFLLNEESVRQSLGKIGSNRMGPAGGSIALARLISQFVELN